ncbi:MAG TPA: helix-turn-helix domain-containing protein [Candidatus Binataceae bacterium]|nr:helix-turn-helix domain-containing protein [Candidatus Binataceae bacterium]
MRLREVAEYLRVSHWKVQRLVHDGKIPGMKIGGAYRFDRRQIDSWVANGGTLARNKLPF